jgi:hypothetical protein
VGTLAAKQVTQIFQARIQAALPDHDVSDSRAHPASFGKTVGITFSDTIDSKLQIGQHQHSLEVIVRIVDIDTWPTSFAIIEEVMLPADDLRLGNLVAFLSLQSTATEASSDGQTAYNIGVMVFLVEYITLVGAPDTFFV